MFKYIYFKFIFVRSIVFTQLNGVAALTKQFKGKNINSAYHICKQETPSTKSKISCNVISYGEPAFKSS